MDCTGAVFIACVAAYTQLLLVIVIIIIIVNNHITYKVYSENKENKED